jgi:hypothetical protein
MNVRVMNEFVVHFLVRIYQEIINVIVIFFIRENNVKQVGEKSIDIQLIEMFIFS